MPHILYSFASVPEFAIPHVRTLRVRWALEEAGLPYETRRVEDLPKDAYPAIQPFSQVPAYSNGDMTLFESGAILLHLAQHVPALMPASEAERAHVTAWMFAALNSVEPYVANLLEIDYFNRDAAWASERRPAVAALAAKRLDQLETWLQEKDYLSGQFSAADILMTTVLRLFGDSELLTSRPALQAYKERCMARPAFRRALDAQVAHFRKETP